MISKRNTAMLKVKDPGFYTSVQDTGRYGYRHMGVPPSGALDQAAASRVNQLLENEDSAALLEMTMHGAILEFTEPTYFALSGASMEVLLNGQAIEEEQVYKAVEGDELDCRHIRLGLRAYLGVRGGILTEKRLGSRSYFKPVTSSNKLKALEELAYEPCSAYEPRILKLSPARLYKEQKLEAYPGPEYDLLNQKQRELLFGREFQLAKEHDRMACQLQGNLPPHDIPMITSATLPGTVQITPSGKLIILLRDGQTTGGYPRILQLSARALNILAQKRFGDSIRFASAGHTSHSF